MSISIAQSRQQLSSLILAAQQTPQVITNRNTPVAVLVSAAYFERSEAVMKPMAETFFARLNQLRNTYTPADNTGLEPKGTAKTRRPTAWKRANTFATSD
jgi:prevent-host-death family protein